jgi:hypothetical protein
MAEPSRNTPVSLNEAVNQYLKMHPTFNFDQLGVRSWLGKRIVIGYTQNEGWKVIDIGVIVATLKACGTQTASSRTIVGKQWKLEGCPTPRIDEKLCPSSSLTPAKWAQKQAESIRQYLQRKMDSMPSEKVDPNADLISKHQPRPFLPQHSYRPSDSDSLDPLASIYTENLLESVLEQLESLKPKPVNSDLMQSQGAKPVSGDQDSEAFEEGEPASSPLLDLEASGREFMTFEGIKSTFHPFLERSSMDQSFKSRESTKPAYEDVLKRSSIDQDFKSLVSSKPDFQEALGRIPIYSSFKTFEDSKLAFEDFCSFFDQFLRRYETTNDFIINHLKSRFINYRSIEGTLDIEKFKEMVEKFESKNKFISDRKATLITNIKHFFEQMEIELKFAVEVQKRIS